MTSEENVDARKLDLEKWRLWCNAQPVDSLFVTVSGSHIYGFPSADSDIDFRGCHRLPIEKVIGLAMPKQTIDSAAVHDQIEVDLVSHEVGKYLGLLVKNNGYILEQVFSPIVVIGQGFLDELRPLAKNCITKNHYFHYRGFYQTQKKLIQKQEPVTAKAMLYAYRVLCTGIHLMKTGEIETDLNVLADEMGLTFISELIAAKVKEKVAFEFDIQDHQSRLDGLENELDLAFEASTVRENPEREPVNDLLVRIRMGGS